MTNKSHSWHWFPLGLSLALGLSAVWATMILFSGQATLALAAVARAPTADITVCPTGTGTCDYNYIQAAVDAATPGDVIKVATGIYTGVQGRPVPSGGVITQVVYISKTITIRGGYTTTNWATSHPITQPTTLDAQGQGRVLYITGNITPTIEGLRITGGDAAGLGGAPWDNDAGGGVYVITATVIISDNYVFSNTANVGGGMANYTSTLTLAHVKFMTNTVTAGLSRGGGMYNWHSSLTLTDITFSGNSAASGSGEGGGMFNTNSSPMLNNVTFISNTATWGGGMYNSGSDLMLTDADFISNTAGFTGGGMYNSGSDLMLTDIDFISNTAGQEGGGMYNYTSNLTATHVTFISNTTTAGFSHGGGMCNSYSSLTLTDVTFSDNSAASGSTSGGGTYHLNSNSTLSNVTFISNTASFGGGMYTENSSPTLSNVTFTNNFGGWGGGGMYNDTSSPTLSNITLIGNTAGQYGGGMYNDTSNLTATLVTVISNTAVWGGGMYNLNSNSTLANVDCISNTAVWGGGIWHRGSLTLTDITFIDNTADLGGGIRYSYGNLMATRVTFINNTAAEYGGGTYNEYVDLTATQVTFISNTANYDGGGMYNSWSSSTLTDADFISNTAGQEGGGMYNYTSDLTATHVTVISNTASSSGGGMYNLNSNSTLTDAKFISNTASLEGGGMWNQSGSLTLTDVDFISNTAIAGGGVYNDQSSPTLTNVTFSGNSVVSTGGGMFNVGSPTLTDVTFSGNTANTGGGMYNEQGSPKLTNVTFVDNFGLWDGGGMYNWGGSAQLNIITFTNNTATTGGGMYNLNSNPELTNATFSGNSANGEGGGIMYYVGSGGGMFNTGSNPTLTDITFISNTAVISGGGMYNHDNSSPTMFYFTFARNKAAGDGGGMYNDSSSPMMTIGIFSGNQADADGNNDGNGGGMYNLGSSPDLINVTFSGNSAMYGGGMANFTLSVPELKNTILWGNIASGGGLQLYDEVGSMAIGSSCMVEGGYTGCFISDTESPFVDADGADNIPGTADDDLHLAHTSSAIDTGNHDLLPPDASDLDGDNDTDEKLPFDLAGDPRCFEDNDLDGAVDDDWNPCEINLVDLGAYEARCPTWHMRYGDAKLEDGQQYRLGFHAELDSSAVTSMTLGYTLDQYAAERAAGNLTEAKKAYEVALNCASTITEINQAVAGILDVTWELATGAMLQGNEEMVQALDLVDVDPSGLSGEIAQLEAAIGYFDEATAGYLAPLTGDYRPYFLAALQLTRTHPLSDGVGYTRTFPLTDTVGHVDLERLASAVTQKSRAYLELAERRFRNGQELQAEDTLREGSSVALVELTLMYSLWPEVVDDANYVAVLRNIADMNRLYGYLVGNKNPFGYDPDFVPFHFDHNDYPDKNNYEQTWDIADSDHTETETRVQLAQAEQQGVHDNYVEMQTRLNQIRIEYNNQLEILCGTDDGGELDVARCADGTIQEQILAVGGAMLRIDKVLGQMEMQTQLIRIEEERAAAVAGVHRATAQLISLDGEELASLAAEEAKLRFCRSDAQGTWGIINGAVNGAFAGGGAVGEQSAASVVFGGLGAVFGAVSEWQAWENEKVVAEQLADVYAAKERLYAKQKATVQYAEADIVLIDSLALQRKYFLELAQLDIDYAIARNNLMQELARLTSLQGQAQYLLAERAKAQAFTALLFQDPAGRVLRDHYMEVANDRYEIALDSAWQAGRALEYEINQDAAINGSVLTNLEDLYPLQDINDLGTALAELDDAYTDWTEGIGAPQLYPDEVLYLSEIVGFVDSYDPTLGRIVTREEKFNAFIRDMANRIDLDGDGTAESLRFAFQTSIFAGNPAFETGVFNDKIVTVNMRVRGSSLGVNEVKIKLTQSGTSFIRTRDAFQDNNCAIDDVRTYSLNPRTATIVAVANDDPFPAGATSYELATRSVAFTNWTLLISKCDSVTECGPYWIPDNLPLNLDNIDEIEMLIDHEAYTLDENPACLPTRAFERQPTRAYRPMSHILPPLSISRSSFDVGRQTLARQSGPNDLNDTYVGTVVISRPLYMAPVELVLVLTDTNGSLSGYISPTLSYPSTDQGADRGPAFSGSWSGDSFDLQSDIFTTTLGSSVIITRQVFLHTGVISESGETLTGMFSETLAGLTFEPLEIVGEFRLDRPVHELVAAFTASRTGNTLPLEVNFTDLSLGRPTSWTWDFGDGATSIEQSPTHTYTQLGNYTVTLTSSNAYNTDTKIEVNYVTITQSKIYLPLILRDH